MPMTISAPSGGASGGPYLPTASPAIASGPLTFPATGILNASSFLYFEIGGTVNFQVSASAVEVVNVPLLLYQQPIEFQGSTPASVIASQYEVVQAGTTLTTNVPTGSTVVQSVNNTVIASASSTGLAVTGLVSATNGLTVSGGSVSLPAGSIAGAALAVSYLPAANPAVNYYATSTTGTATYVATLAPVPASFAALTGVPLQVTFTAANTGASTLNVNGLGAKALTKQGATALVANDILAGLIATVVYDGTEFQLTDPATILASAVTAGTFPGAAYTIPSPTVTGTLTLPSAAIAAPHTRQSDGINRFAKSATTHSIAVLHP